LTFKSVEISGQAAAADVEATSNVQTRGPEAVLEVTVSAPPKDGVRAAIADGPVAQLMFTVAKTLKPETVIPLKLDASGASIKVGGAAVKVGARGSEIIVSNATAISCFFYMH
jgi:hypothetical protein